MSSDQRVNVIVVHYADPIQTESCVRHLRAQHPAVVEDIQVIDNSVGRDAEELRRLLPSESICETGRNLGFADGVNVGMTRVCASDPDFVWVVTPDAMPDPQCLRVLLQAMVADSELGICGPVIDADGELIVGCRLVEALGFLVRINTIAPEALETLPKVLPTDFVEGCSMLIRTDAARALGIFLVLRGVRVLPSGARSWLEACGGS
jgi:GT2 family glycosyltransferase